MTRAMDLDTAGLEFTRSWFRTRNLGTFREYVYPEFSGKPVTYLELGVFEGMSMCWMLQHILTHPDSRAVGVDPWLMTRKLGSSAMHEVMERACNNIAAVIGKAEGLDRLNNASNVKAAKQLREKEMRAILSPNEQALGALTWCGASYPGRLLIRSTSVEFLNKCCTHGYLGIGKGSLDLCMIDGNHWAPFVAEDARLVYQLMKPGGLILFDDVENDHEKTNHVKQGIEIWLASFVDRPTGKNFHDFVRLEWSHKYMRAYRKL